MHFRRGASVQGARGSGEVTWGPAAQGEVSLRWTRGPSEWRRWGSIEKSDGRIEKP